jgi:hypothetical protein
MPSQKFAHKYLLAVKRASQGKPESGLNGFEREGFLVLANAFLYTK